MAATNFDEGLPGVVMAKYNQSTLLQALRIRLYTAISPALGKATVKANFTEVTATMAYAAKTVGSFDFATVLDTTNHWVTASATYTWVFTAGAGLTILGWYATDSGNTKAIMGEQFASPVVIPAAGGTLQVIIADKYKDC